MTSGVRCVFLLGGKSYGKSQRNGDERSMRSTITVIDFGTSKVVALVAEVSGRQRTDIIGAGIASYDGFADARWNNPKHFVCGNRGYSEWLFSGSTADGKEKCLAHGVDLFEFENGKIKVKDTYRKQRLA